MGRALCFCSDCVIVLVYDKLTLKKQNKRQAKTCLFLCQNTSIAQIFKNVIIFQKKIYIGFNIHNMKNSEK